MHGGPTLEDCLERVDRNLTASENAPRVAAFLESGQKRFASVIETDGNATTLDLSVGQRLGGEPLKGIAVDRFSELVDAAMADAGTAFAFGRYGEPRELYHTELFASGSSQAAERRDVHLGIDVFCTAGTEVRTPLDGSVAILANNTDELDYGPMLVLRHETNDGSSFFLLFGHLALASIDGVSVGDRVSAGDRIAAVGSPPENGNWPPHLHLQVITDLLGLGADFPGVAYRSQLPVWLSLSPSPAAFFPDYPASALNYLDDPAS